VNNGSNHNRGSGVNRTDGELFTAEMRVQLETVFERMENKLVLKLYLNQRPVSKELKEYVEGLVSMTDKLTMMVESGNDEQFAPCVKIYRENDSYTGLAFHGVPGGHEFTSFVLGMYNAAGPGQALEEDTSMYLLGKRISNRYWNLWKAI